MEATTIKPSTLNKVMKDAVANCEDYLTDNYESDYFSQIWFSPDQLSKVTANILMTSNYWDINRVLNFAKQITCHGESRQHHFFIFDYELFENFILYCVGVKLELREQTIRH
ncbi:hypothetical protein [Dysgonomonas sp. Marseille-P4361]|uniref:hypothetical protein n=1 Tax=Dysgonomonas sp. Marseille-P4361 TaxID=2161820 RepID=UPI000D55A30F|nr:hypothetical protein [Dysgonomonas sp. Marseille-P4361]